MGATPQIEYWRKRRGQRLSATQRSAIHCGLQIIIIAPFHSDTDVTFYCMQERELIQQQVHKNKRIHFMDQFSHQVNFLICRLCFWCASCTDESYEFTGKCPMCDIFNSNIESLPVLNIWEIRQYARK